MGAKLASMCCFSGPVESVSNTAIFARSGQQGRQFLVYQMTVKAVVPLAMILPLPVADNAGETAVDFIDLSAVPEFFARLNKMFLTRSSRAMSPSPLRVVEVGSYVASYVPTLADFDRLDGHFRLSQQVWDQLPQYQNYGFAVFQLKEGEHKVHPMAFDFPRRNPDQLFFPTVHIHDGRVHTEAEFDHALFCPRSSQTRLSHWMESPGVAELAFRESERQTVGQIVSHDRPVYKLELRGLLPNQDTVVSI